MVTCCLLCRLKALNSLRYYFHKIQRPRRPRQNVPGKPNLLRQTRSNPTVANTGPSSGEATCLWSCSIISDHVKSSGCWTACSVLSVLRQGELADNVRDASHGATGQNTMSLVHSHHSVHAMVRFIHRGVQKVL